MLSLIFRRFDNIWSFIQKHTRTFRNMVANRLHTNRKRVEQVRKNRDSNKRTRFLIGFIQDIETVDPKKKLRDIS